MSNLLNRPDELDDSSLWRFVYSCPLALLLVDRDGSVRILNGAATALLVPYCTDSTLDNLFTLLASWDEDAASALRSAVGQSTNQLVARTIQISAAGMPALWLRLCATPFHQGLSVTCEDVTQMVTQQQELLRAMNEAAHQRGRAELGAAVLHDMGNALTGIGSQIVAIRGLVDDDSIITNLHRLVGFLTPHVAALDQLLGPGRGQGVLGLLTSLHDASRQAQAHVQDHLHSLGTYIAHAQELLAISRTYAGSSAMLEAELTRLLADLREMSDHSIHKREGTLVVIPPAPPARLLAHRSQVMQILLNLVKNAVEAWDADPARPLHVQVAAAWSDSGGIQVSVRDNGCGFEPEIASTLFEPGVSTKERSSGIGLYACRSLAESFGGSITLTSPGRGRGALAILHIPPEIITRE